GSRKVTQPAERGSSLNDRFWSACPLTHTLPLQGFFFLVQRAHTLPYPAGLIATTVVRVVSGLLAASAGIATASEPSSPTHAATRAGRRKDMHRSPSNRLS